MSNLFNVSAAPHIRDDVKTSDIMLDVIIALLPASVFGIYNFGLNALWIILVSVITCVLTEWIYEKLMKKKVTIGDLSAVVTGLLLALNMPSTIPLWIPVIGGIFAILVVKMLYGGIGQNFMNPALAARCFLLICFAGRMSTYAVDGVTGATPLGMLKEGTKTDWLTMVTGTYAGTIGETSVLAILIGGIYLLLKRVISFRIPVLYIITTAAFVFLFGGQGMDMNFVLTHVLGGGLLLGAFFMATDYATSPITPWGQVLYGIILGIITGVFRVFGSAAEGVSYAIILGNLLVPLIEKITLPVPFGKRGVKHASK